MATKVLDSWALIAFFEDEPAAEEVEKLLHQAADEKHKLLLCVVNWGEIYYNTMREVCLALMQADSEADVIRILREVNLWDNKRIWRLYGDRENNFSTIGNQQSKPDAALVEKLVNSVDARLMHECLARGVNPESPA